MCTIKQWMRTMLPSAIVMLAAGWFTACSKDEPENITPAVPPTEDTMLPISFGSAVDDVQQTTRAGQPFHEKRQNFVLTAYKHMDDAYTLEKRQAVMLAYNVDYNGQGGSTTDNAAGWYYVGGTSTTGAAQTIKYWDLSAAAYRFMAVSGSALRMDDLRDNQGRSIGRRLEITINGQNEDGGGTSTPYLTHTQILTRDSLLTHGLYKSPVTMTFYKPLARVRFMLVDESGQAITKNSLLADFIDASSFRFYPTDNSRVRYRGTFVSTHHTVGMQPEELTPAATPGYQAHTALTIPYESPSADGYAFVTEAQKERWWHVLESSSQQSYTSYTLEFLYNGVKRSAVVPAEYMQWRVGYAYTYVFKVFASSEVGFEPDLYTYSKWQAGYADNNVEWDI